MLVCDESMDGRLAELIDQRTGVTNALLAEATAARKRRDEEALRYAQARVLWDELQALVEDGDTALARLVAASESAQFVEESGRVVGVKPNDLTGGADESEAIVQRKTVPRLEQRLQSKAHSIAQFGGALTLEKLVSEAHEVAAAEQAMIEEAAELEELRERAIEERRLLLEEVVEAERLRNERVTPAIATQAEWMAAQAEGMACKMSLVEKRLMRDTYNNRDTMAALGKLRAALTAAAEASSARKQALLVRKSQFASAGPEMERIATEYAAVLKSIEETQWALKEVTKQ